MSAQLTPMFFNVNEDGETYGHATATLQAAMVLLRMFPNDTITVRLVTPACVRWLTEADYGLDDALRDGMSDREYALIMTRGMHGENVIS